MPEKVNLTRKSRTLHLLGTLTIAGLAILVSPSTSSGQSVDSVAASTNAVEAPSPPNESPAEPRVLLVSTKKIEPFVFVDDKNQVAGYSIDLWDAVAKRLNVAYKWEVRKTVKEVLADVTEKRADLGIAGISMTPDREAVLDFSHPFFDSGLQILARKANGPNPLAVLWKTVRSRDLRYPFGLLFGFAIIIAHIMWLVERKNNPDFPKKYLPGVWEGFWWASVNVMTGGDAEKKVGRGVARLVALAWMTIGVLLVAYVTGAVASALTVSQLESDIQSVRDLQGRRVLTTTGSTAAEYLERIGIPVRTVPALEPQHYEQLLNNDIDAIVYDSPSLRYAANRYGRNRLAVVGQIFEADKYGIALPTGSPLREQINATLLQLQRDGTYADLATKWFGSED